MSSSANSPVSGSDPDPAVDWPLMPTETEIYILPDGQVVIADLPAELSDFVDLLGDVEPCTVDFGAEANAPISAPTNPPDDV